MTQNILKTTIQGSNGLGNKATFWYDVKSDQLVAMHPDGHWLPMRRPTHEERKTILASASEVSKSSSVDRSDYEKELLAFAKDAVTEALSKRIQEITSAYAQHIMSTSIQVPNELGDMTTLWYFPITDQLVAMHPHGHWTPMRRPTNEERAQILLAADASVQSDKKSAVALAQKIREITSTYFSGKELDGKAAARTILAIETEATLVLSNSL